MHQAPPRPHGFLPVKTPCRITLWAIVGRGNEAPISHIEAGRTAEEFAADTKVLLETLVGLLRSTVQVQAKKSDGADRESLMDEYHRLALGYAHAPELQVHAVNASWSCYLMGDDGRLCFLSVFTFERACHCAMAAD